MKLTLKKPPLPIRVEAYYPTYKKLAEKGKKPSFYRRMFSGKTLAGCEMKAHCEKELAQQKENLANELKIWSASRERGLILEHVRDMICLADLAGTIVSSSKSYEQVLGYSEEELRGKSIFALVHPDDLAAAEVAFKQGIGNGGEGAVDVRVRRNPRIFGENSHIWAEIRGNVVYGENGCPVCTVLVSRDVTEYKRMEEDLRHSYVEMAKFLSIVSHDLRGPFNAMMGFAGLLLEALANIDSRKPIETDSLRELVMMARQMVSVSESLYVA